MILVATLSFVPCNANLVDINFVTVHLRVTVGIKGYAYEDMCILLHSNVVNPRAHFCGNLQRGIL